MAKSDSQQTVFDIFDSHSDDLVAFYFGDNDDLLSEFPDSECSGKDSLLSVLEAGLGKPVEDIEIHAIPHVSDPVRHVGKRSTILQPGIDECTNLLKQLNFDHPPTSWISMTTKLHE